MSYSPLYIKANETGLVQSRENFILPNDAYPTRENAYVWRERIKRKQGVQLLGRLQRSVANFPISAPLLGVTDGSGNFTGNLFTILVGLGLIKAIEFPSIVLGTVQIAINTYGIFTDSPLNNGSLSNGSGGTGTINYVTGVFTLTTNNGAYAGQNIHLYTLNYYPCLPVMGLRMWEQQNSTNDRTIAFDQVYAYNWNGTAWQEWIPGTTWNAKGEPPQGDANIPTISFFWTTNYWLGGANTPFAGSVNVKLFWVTNNTGFFGVLADPIRVTDGATWVPFQPSIDITPNKLNQCLALLPFRGRLLAFNTWEGVSYAASFQFSNRIRWSAIGNPFSTNAWRDDIRGQGGFLDIPTSEDIVSVGFVRDNLVIYCERSTWQLRYTGRSIAPFQIEKVNSELGAEGTFSAVQFDTSLIGIGDKGVVECDSFKSQRIDIKIPDLVFDFQNANNGPSRVYGIRDFERRLAYWSYPYYASNGIFPDRRLCYNYENDSWSIFLDSFTCYGTFQATADRTWNSTPYPWIECNFPWQDQLLDTPSNIGGNQQGFVEYLNILTSNDISLYISAITAYGVGLTPTLITSPNHNMQTGYIISISNIPVGTPFAYYDGMIFGIVVVDANTFTLNTYNASEDAFNNGVTDAIPGTPYVGGGTIAIRDNFNIISKKFNFLDEGQSIQLGYLDILMDSSDVTDPGAISMNVYLDYNDNESSNAYPQNIIDNGAVNAITDTFFNTIIPTTQSTLNLKGGSKFWQRVICPTRSNFITIQYTFSNSQMNGLEQENDVQIDSQVLWLRPAGRLSQLS